MQENGNISYIGLTICSWYTMKSSFTEHQHLFVLKLCSLCVTKIYFHMLNSTHILRKFCAITSSGKCRVRIKGVVITPGVNFMSRFTVTISQCHELAALPFCASKNPNLAPFIRIPKFVQVYTITYCKDISHVAIASVADNAGFYTLMHFIVPAANLSLD